MKKLLFLLLPLVAACGSDSQGTNEVPQQDPGGYYTKITSFCSQDQSGVRVYLTSYDNNIFVIADSNCP